jgi:hypothetical protein
MKKKTSKKPSLLEELTNRKMEEQKSGALAESKSKYKPKKQRNENRSNVGPSWGGRKGN